MVMMRNRTMVVITVVVNTLMVVMMVLTNMLMVVIYRMRIISSGTGI